VRSSKSAKRLPPYESLQRENKCILLWKKDRRESKTDILYQTNILLSLATARSGVRISNDDAKFQKHCKKYLTP